MKAIASSAVGCDLLEGKNVSGISEFGIIAFPLQSIPCVVLKHMVWHFSGMLNSILMWFKWKVRFMNTLLSHTALKIGLCWGTDTDNHSKALSVPLMFLRLHWVWLGLLENFWHPFNWVSCNFSKNCFSLKIFVLDSPAPPKHVLFPSLMV